MSGWADTPTAVYLASLGYVEREFRSAERVSRDWVESRGSAPSEVELRQSMLVDRLGPRVVTLPDMRSPLESAADRLRADQRTQIRVLDDAQVRAEVVARSAAIMRAGTIRPAGQSDRPYWSAEKNQGLMYRMVSFGPPHGFEAAGQVFAEWQVEDAVRQEAINASLPPGSPR